MSKNGTQKVKVTNPPPIAGVYFLGFIGSAVHFVGNAEGFGEVVLAFLKASVWPAFLINKVFDLLQV